MTVLNKKIRFYELVKEKHLADIITDTDLINVIAGSPNRRNSIIKRLLAKKELIPIRRGLYVLGELYRSKPIDTIELANKIYGPSYLSFESALSYWGLIPEAVYLSMNASAVRSQKFETPMGDFLYTRVPCNPFLTEVCRIKKGDAIHWVATPLKAICDWVYTSKQEWTLARIADSLRIDDFPPPKKRELQILKASYTNRRVLNFLETL